MNGKLFPKMTQEKGVKNMPKVGDKSFPYTTVGMEAAEDYAMETGQEVDNIPTYDAGGRVQNIKGYGDELVGPSMLPEPNGAMTDEEAVKYLNPLATAKEGGKVKKYIKSESGKYEEEHPFAKSVRKSREKDIKSQAKGIVSGKHENLDVTDIVKEVKAKEKENIKTHKRAMQKDKSYKARKAAKGKKAYNKSVSGMAKKMKAKKSK
jgi:hypothetical protein